MNIVRIYCDCFNKPYPDTMDEWLGYSWDAKKIISKKYEKLSDKEKEFRLLIEVN